MATYSKLPLSGSSFGRSIDVSATASPGTLIHTTDVSATTIDEIWLYAFNTDLTSYKLTIEYGGTTSPDDLVEITIAGEKGLFLIIPGLILRGTGVAGTTIRAFSASASTVRLIGYVNRFVA